MWVTASTSMVRLEVVTADTSAFVYSRFVVVNPQPDQFLVTESPMQTIVPCGLMLTTMSMCISALVIPAGHSQQCVPRISGNRVR